MALVRVADPRFRARLDAPGPSRREHTEQVIAYVDTMLEERLKWWPDLRRPIIFDIDDTLLVWREDEREVAIPSVVALYKKYLKMGFPIYIVTARPDDAHGTNRRLTAEGLKALGIDRYRQMFLLPREKIRNPGRFKWETRQLIARQDPQTSTHPTHPSFGIVTIGDQPWDALPPQRNLLNDDEGSFHGGMVVITEGGEGEVGVMLPTAEYTPQRWRRCCRSAIGSHASAAAAA